MNKRASKLRILLHSTYVISDSVFRCANAVCISVLGSLPGLNFPNLEICIFHSCSLETRLRNCDKLLCNLKAVDQAAEASDLGFEFPGPQSLIMEEAISIFAHLHESSQEPGEEEEEEELEWDTGSDEEEMD